MTYEIETQINFDLIYGIENEEVEEVYPSAKCIKKNYEYPFDFYCYNYALERIAKKLKTVRKTYWKAINGCQDGYKFLEDFFEQIPIEEAKRGDIITYHEISNVSFCHHSYEEPCKNNCVHFAIVYRTNKTLKGTIVKSKWGRDGVFKTAVEDVPDIYGNAIVIWRKK